MRLTRLLYDFFLERARHVRVSTLAIGLKYTAVTTDDGGIGVAFTFGGHQHGCPREEYRDFEGRPAVELLASIEDAAPLHRSMALALVNALNHADARGLSEDSTDSGWMDALGIGRDKHIAMVGFIRPIAQKCKDRGALVEVLDDGQGIGDRSGFYRKLNGWADVLLLTATSILNDSTEEVIGHLAHGAQAAILGPSTPMVVEAFGHLPVRVLAGSVPMVPESVLKAVRHGQGTPVLHRFSRKVVSVRDM